MTVQVLMIAGVLLAGVYVLDNIRHKRHPIDRSSLPSEKILVVNRSCDDGLAHEAKGTLTVGSVDAADLER